MNKEAVLNKTTNKQFRRKLRRNSTDAERLFWSKVRGKQIDGNKFFRQYGIKNYIVDFCCPKRKLVIEIDGGQHYEKEGEETDKVRGDTLRDLGYGILRFSNLDVLKNIDGTMRRVSEYLVD